MNEFLDDFDDFENEEFMDNDSFEDRLDGAKDNLEDFEDLTEPDDELLDDSDVEGESQPEDEFTAKDAFIIGGAMGYAYHEGRRERKRRKRKKLSDESD
jgi:hypothetical protein